MPAESPAPLAASFEIKSANLPLVALLLRSADLAQLARELAQRFDDIPNFFEQDPLVIDLSPLAHTAYADAPIDFLVLTQLLRQYQLQPLAVKGGSAAHMADALAAGLVAAGDAQVLQARVPHPAAAAPVAAPPPDVIVPVGALVVDKPLRSGQQVYARGRDLVVLSMVNPGAEVIADGSIHVYAPLRGKAIAGARGNSDARIFSLALDAELLSIAGVYRTSDTPLPVNVKNLAAQVQLLANEDGDKLVISPMVG
jgi:septum site-determining protein MinC